MAFVVTCPEEFRRQAEAVFNRHPRPWVIAGMGAHGEGSTYAQIIDANGACVVGSSEWLTFDEGAMVLFVSLINLLEVR